MNPTTLTLNQTDTNDFRFLQARPGITVVLQADKPVYTILAVSNDFVTTSGRKREEVIGKGHFQVFPENPADPSLSGVHSLKNSFNYILQYKTSHSLPLVRYDIPDGNGGFLEKYWKSTNAPVLNEEGEVAYIIHTSEDVTDRVRADLTEEKLQELQLVHKKVQESEAKYSTLFNSMDQGFCIIEVIFDKEQQPIDYLFVEANPVFEKQTGLKGAVGRMARELVPDLENHWIERYGAVALTGQSARFKDASKAMGRWFDVYAFRIESNESHRVAILFTDITDQTKAGEVIIQSEQRFRSMVEQAPVAIAVSRGEDLVIEVANERMLQLLNQTTHIIGKPYLEAVPEMREQPIIEVLRAVLKTGEPFYGSELMVPIPKGEIWEDRYFNVVYQPLVEDGNVVGIMNVATEVTEQVQVRKKVEESQQRFFTLANSVTQLAWIADAEGWIYWYNDRWFDYTGTTLEEMQGWGWQKVHHPDHIDRVVSFVKDAWGRDESWELIFPLRRHDGVYRWFLTRGVPVRNKDGKVVQWIGTNTDIDDQKQAEALLEQRVKDRTLELEMRNSELEQFTYVSHHDLQEPIRKITMFTDLIKAEAKEKLSEGSQIMLQKVSDAAFRMSAALRDVLDFASLSKGEQFVDVDLDEVLAVVQCDLEVVIHEKRATITSDALPTIKGIPNQMHQLFYNLVNNALKFSKPDESPRVTITCAALHSLELAEYENLDKNKDYYSISIQDNGIGFNQEYADKIFGLFQRLHTRTDYAGTGIGLALVKKVVSNHGGVIWAEGKDGIGATFKMLLPMG
jgi:PAS domain S-box-containing protein